MKILNKKERIQHGNFEFTRYQYSNNSYEWRGSNNKQLFDYVEMELEKKYQKLNPNKTLNPSKKGFDLKKLSTHAYASPAYDVTIKVNELIEYLSTQANGETPEEANPVGQVEIREIYYSKTASLFKFYAKNKNDETPVRKDDIKLIEINCNNEIYHNIILMLYEISKLYFNKPLETTKEQP